RTPGPTARKSGHSTFRARTAPATRPRPSRHSRRAAGTASAKKTSSSSNTPRWDRRTAANPPQGRATPSCTRSTRRQTKRRGRRGGEDLLMIEYSWMGSEDGGEATSGAGTADVYALGTATGDEAWAGRWIDEAGQSFGGRLVELAPDR